MFAILAFGDSITFGRGELPSLGWPGRLKEHFEPQNFHNAIFNLGIPGDTSTSLLERFETEIKARIKYKFPEDQFIIVIGIGANDSRGLGSTDKLETKPIKFKSNIKKLIKISKKYTKNIVFVSLVPVDEDKMPFEDTYFFNNVIKKYNAIIKIEAKSSKIHYIDLFTLFSKQRYKKLLIDGLHPNNKGYDLIYKIVKDFLVKKKIIN